MGPIACVCAWRYFLAYSNVYEQGLKHLSGALLLARLLALPTNIRLG